MSIFNFDTEIPFSEYVNTITVYGEMYRPKPKTVEGLLALATSLRSSVLSVCAEGRYDVGYYYCIESLQIFDPKKTAVPVNKSERNARVLLLWFVDTAEKIKRGGLAKLYSERLADIKNREPERLQILKQQMEVDTETRSLHEHNLRRQQLLQTKTADESQLLNALGNHTGGSAGIRCGDELAALRTTALTPSMPLAQYGSLYASADNIQPLVHGTTPAAPGTNTASSGSATPWRFPRSPSGGSSGHRGMVNLGNTCYMNSVIQVLNATPLAAFFLSNDYVSELVEKTGNYSKVVNAFSFVIRELHRKGCTFPVSPSSLKSAVATVYEPFNNSKQQDANEFLRVILDAVHTGLNANASNRATMPDIDNSRGTDDQLARTYWWQYAQRNDSVVVDLCGFQERSMVTCPECGHSSRSFFATLGIEVPVPSGSGITLDKCLRQYCAEETLDNDSLYQCPGCHRKVNARKQLQLYSSPKVLFITLKRFQHMGDFSNVAKVTASVAFPQKLNLKTYMCSSFPTTEYELVGIVNHQGNMHGGHYTADVCDDGTWFHASDEVVNDATAPNTSLAYVLCYRRTA